MASPMTISSSEHLVVRGLRLLDHVRIAGEGIAARTCARASFDYA